MTPVIRLSISFNFVSSNLRDSYFGFEVPPSSLSLYYVFSLYNDSYQNKSTYLFFTLESRLRSYIKIIDKNHVLRSVHEKNISNKVN